MKRLLKTAVDAGNQGQIAEQHDALCEVLLQQEQYVAALRHADESLTRFKSLKSLTMSLTARFSVPTSCGGWAGWTRRIGNWKGCSARLRVWASPRWPSNDRVHCVVRGCCWRVTRINAPPALPDVRSRRRRRARRGACRTPTRACPRAGSKWPRGRGPVAPGRTKGHRR